MSFHTIFVVLRKKGGVIVSPYLGASEALEYFQCLGEPGEIYACKVSTGTAAEVNRTGSLDTLKAFAHSMQKVGDVT